LKTGEPVKRGRGKPNGGGSLHTQVGGTIEAVPKYWRGRIQRGWREVCEPSKEERDLETNKSRKRGDIEEEERKSGHTTIS